MEKFNKIKIIIFLLLVTCYLLLVTVPPAQASALSLGVNPPIITINAIPPTTAISTLSIQNKSDVEVTLQIQIKPFKAKGENGELVYSKEALEIFESIQILDADTPIQNITLGPRQQRDLILNINIPQDASISARPPATSSNQSQINQAGVAGEVGRDYYFSVVFVSTNFSPIESNSSINQIGITTNVLLSIGAKENPKASIEEFSSNIFFEKGPVPFTIRIKNTGTHFIKPKGEITIKNMFGQSIGKLDLYSMNVLSNSIRAIPNKDSSDFKRPTTLWKENFLLGFYTATLNISMSDEGPTFIKSIRFFAFPFQGLIIIVIIAIIVIVIRNRLKFYMDNNRT